MNLNLIFLNISIETSLTLLDCLYLNLVLLLFGFLGVMLNSRNLLIILVCLELIYLSVGLNFAIFGFFLHNPLGYVYCVLVITVAAAETAIGISLLIVLYSVSNKVSFNSLISLSG